MKLLRLFRTVRYLRPEQIIARLRFRFRRVSVGAAVKPIIAAMRGKWVQPTARHGELLNGGRFRLLNLEIDIDADGGWNQAGHDKLLLYHLHYLDVLNAREGALDADRGGDLIDRWISDNPPPGGNGWEPYPLSLRIVNLIKWHANGHSLSDKATESLFLQSRALAQQLEYHLLANHLFANAKALYCAGLFFSCPEARSWQTTGARILQREIDEQILSDGGHFELSPMYQATIAEDLLDIINLSRAFKDASLLDVDAKATKMLRWLTLMTHPDGQLAYFNDATQGVTASLADLQAYARRLGVGCTQRIQDGIHRLSASGYVRYQLGNIAVLVDFGDIGPEFQPGHAHCDLLSFELSIGQRRYFVNTGISTYNANARRNLERSTASHNTVSIAGVEQSEIWSAFRVGRRARPFGVELGKGHVQASHDGYRHKGIVHQRRFEFGDTELKIEDSLDGKSADTGVANFHFHPDVKPVLAGNMVEVDGINMMFQNAMAIDLLDFDFCAGFNKRRASKKIAVVFEKALTTRIKYENLVHQR